MVAEDEALTEEKILGDMNAKTLVDAFGDTVRDEKTATKDEKLNDIEVETWVEALARRLTKEKVWDIKPTVHNVKGEIEKPRHLSKECLK